MWTAFFELHCLCCKSMFSDGEKCVLSSMSYIIFALKSMFSYGEKCVLSSMSYIFFAVNPCFQMERNVECLL
jgi:hypothetical protein